MFWAHGRPPKNKEPMEPTLCRQPNRQIQQSRPSRLPPADIGSKIPVQYSEFPFATFRLAAIRQDAGSAGQQRQMFSFLSSSRSSLCCSALKVDIRSCSTCSAPDPGENGSARGCRWPIGACGIDVVGWPNGAARRRRRR
jgi:hypothetical protein